jgi:hypothetical protein
LDNTLPLELGTLNLELGTLNLEPRTGASPALPYFRILSHKMKSKLHQMTWFSTKSCIFADEKDGGHGHAPRGSSPQTLFPSGRQGRHTHQNSERKYILNNNNNNDSKSKQR